MRGTPRRGDEHGPGRGRWRGAARRGHRAQNPRLGHHGPHADEAGRRQCLHAQLADELLSRDNAVGKAVLEGLEARGVDASGSDVCGEQCSGCVDGWRYTPRKNKQKLRTTLAPHKKLRELSLAGYATSFRPGAARGRRGGGAGEELILGADGGVRRPFYGVYGYAYADDAFVFAPGVPSSGLFLALLLTGGASDNFVPPRPGSRRPSPLLGCPDDGFYIVDLQLLSRRRSLRSLRAESTLVSLSTACATWK